MNDIGGYLELETLIHHEYYPNLLRLNTARNALVYLCRTRKLWKVYLPYFLCDSVSGVCDREGIVYDFYPIGPDLRPRFDGELGEGEALYLVNYYGQLADSEVLAYQAKYGRIILDNVQAFFAAPLPEVDTIYSCRKFFGVPDGAYLATEARLSEPLELDHSMDRMRHLLGRLEGESASAYYADFKANDQSFETLPLLEMSKVTQSLLGAIDYERAKQRREENWEYYAQALGAGNRLVLTKPAGPYMYPFYCENGLTVKKRLAELKIYIPTLWPNVLELPGEGLEQDYAANILPLPVDQRYNTSDIKTVISALL